MKHFLIASVLMLLIGFSTAYCAEVQLTWNPVEFGDKSLPSECGYKVYYGGSSGDYDNVVTIIKDENTWSKELPDGTYYFVVTAFNKFGESGYSNEVFGTVDDPEIVNAPDGLTISIKSSPVTININ